MPGRPIPEKGDKSKLPPILYHTVKKSDIREDNMHGEIVKETTIDGIEYVEFKKRTRAAPLPSLGTNFKPIEELENKKNVSSSSKLKPIEELESLEGEEGEASSGYSNI
jgi:hypothetical protein